MDNGAISREVLEKDVARFEQIVLDLKGEGDLPGAITSFEDDFLVFMAATGGFRPIPYSAIEGYRKEKTQQVMQQGQAVVTQKTPQMKH